MIDTPATDVLRPRSATDPLPDAPSLSSRRVLVTGAHGFIGAHLLARLRDVGADVHAVVRPDRAPLDALHGLPGRRRVTWHEADVLGWRPTTSLTTGLTETVHWHLTRRDAELETEAASSARGGPTSTATRRRTPRR